MKLAFAGPVAQAQWTAWLANGWSASASVAGDSHSNERGVVHLGYSRPVSDDFELGVGLTRYAYSGTNVHAWRRSEASAAISYRDIATVGIAAMRFDATGASLQWAADAAVRWPVSPSALLLASMGTAATPAASSGRYAYGALGVEWRIGNFHVSASRVASHALASSRYATEQRPRWVAVVGWTLE